MPKQKIKDDGCEIVDLKQFTGAELEKKKRVMSCRSFIWTGKVLMLHAAHKSGKYR